MLQWDLLYTGITQGEKLVVRWSAKEGCIMTRR
jgi:hypothetical protein